MHNTGFTLKYQRSFVKLLKLNILRLPQRSISCNSRCPQTVYPYSVSNAPTHQRWRSFGFGTCSSFVASTTSTCLLVHRPVFHSLQLGASVGDWNEVFNNKKYFQTLINLFIGPLIGRNFSHQRHLFDVWSDDINNRPTEESCQSSYWLRGPKTGSERKEMDYWSSWNLDSTIDYFYMRDVICKICEEEYEIVNY